MRSILLLTLACAGCALSPDARETEAQRPAALLDAYLIAHGMARSYALSRSAAPDVVLQLARLDMKAMAAVRTHDSSATADAVQALTAYAAAQSAADAAPAPIR